MSDDAKKILQAVIRILGFARSVFENVLKEESKTKN